MAQFLNSSFVDDEGSRATMRTPDCELSDDGTRYQSLFEEDDSDKLSPLKLLAVSTNEPTQSSENLQEIPFDRNEWLVVEPFSGRQRPPRQNEFLQRLLNNPRYSSYITWTDQSTGLFTILLPNEVARLWQKVKHRQTSKEMNYDKFSRSLRSNYHKGLMEKTYKKYTFRFVQPTNQESNM